ncbi:MAG: AMP-binding protein [bacterium]|nr:AMP-binding protein [bacterium]
MLKQINYVFGEFIEHPLNISDMEVIFKQARNKLKKIYYLPVYRIIDSIDKVLNLWKDENSFYYKETLKLMPDIVGFSDKMIKLAIDELIKNFIKENLVKRLDVELKDLNLLDKWLYDNKSNVFLRVNPIGVLVHITAGNVFVSAIDSLLSGLITKNINIIKTSSKVGTTFGILFSKSFLEIDKELASLFAIINFDYKDKKLIDLINEYSDGVIVWGGRDSTKYFLENIEPTKNIVIFGPKYSISVIDVDIFLNYNIDFICENLAYDISLWEQRACSSPQVIYIVGKTDIEFLKYFAHKLSFHLNMKLKEILQYELSFDEYVEQFVASELAISKEVLNKAIYYDRVVIDLSDDEFFFISPLNRFVYIKNITDIDFLVSKLENKRDILQSCSILTTNEKLYEYTEKLATINITRFTNIGLIAHSYLNAPYEGDYILKRFSKLVSIEKNKSNFDTFLEEDLSKLKPFYITNKLIFLFKYAYNNSDFYKKIYSKVLENNGISDINEINESNFFSIFYQLPLINKDDIYEHSLTGDKGILTSYQNCYVFSTGGTTGKHKYVAYSFDEFEKITYYLSQIYFLAGISKDDVVANLFMSGNLWTSFIAVNKALEALGCIILPISGNTNIELIIEYLSVLKPNVILGIPTQIIEIAKYIEQNNLDISIEKIFYGGEVLYDNQREYLKKVLKTKLIRSAGYASVDAGPIAYQCKYLTGNQHHILTNYQFVEIIDPDTNKIINFDSDEIGEIVVTNLERFLMPVIRYKTGDLGRWISNECKCLRSSYIIELLGRFDDWIRLASYDFYYQDFINALETIEYLEPFVQLKISRKEYYLQIFIKLKNFIQINQNKLNEIKQQYLNNLKKINWQLKEGIETNLIKFEINFVKDFIKNPKTGKILKIIYLD